MLTAVIDCNVLVSGLIKPGGTPGIILTHFITRRSFKLVVSPPILNELGKALFYPHVRPRIHLTDEEIARTVTTIQVLAEAVSGDVPVDITMTDQSDSIYLAAAQQGAADYLVTGDKQFLKIPEYKGIPIIRPRRFLELING